MTRAAFLALFLLAVSFSARAGESAAGMREVMALRFDNIDALDASDSYLVAFLSGMGGNGAAIAPLRALVGPQLRNPYLSGLVVDAWLEGLLVAPERPGFLAWVWVFPVENRDEYLVGLERQGMSNAEGVDEVSVLRKTDIDGNVSVRYLEWLPGGIAVFGGNREAVRAVRAIYEAAGASRGLLGVARGRELSPDVSLRLAPSRFAAWQDAVAGVYWWRTQVMRLAAELAGFWQAEPARVRLINSLAEDLAALPTSWSGCELGVWFMEDAVEWKFALNGAPGRSAPLSQLSGMRRLPEGVGEAYAFAIDANGFADLEKFIGRLLLGAAGGVAPPAARDAASSFAKMLSQAGASQAAIGWLPAPVDSPSVGSARLMLVEWARPELLDAAWLVFKAALASDGPVAAAFAQLGWRVELVLPGAVPDSCRLIIRPAGRNVGADAQPYCDVGFVARRRGPWLALAWGACGAVDQDLAATLRHRAGLAEAALRADDPAGSPDTRSAFTLMGPAGASFMMTLSPVRFLQALFAEAADWRALAPDEPEPKSTRHAREMYEYRDAGGAWTLAGTKRDGAWNFNGRMSWTSLRALAVALGVAETFAPVGDDRMEGDLVPLDRKAGPGQP